MDRIKEGVATIVRGLIRGAVTSTVSAARTGPLVTAGHPNPDDLINKPQQGAKLSSGKKTTSKRAKKVTLKIKENYEEKVRVAYQRPQVEPQPDNDVGDDTKPPLPKEDELNLKRRNAMKRFKAYFDV